MMKRPNIILISIDTLRADHLSCYGYHRRTTPNIDNIASEGTVFLRNYSTGVWTPPGHASMLTGLYVSEHGVYGDNQLDRDIPTIAEKLREYGYQTAAFINNSQVGKLVGFDRGHDIFIEVWRDNTSKSLIKKILRRAGSEIKGVLGYGDLGACITNKLCKKWIENSVDNKKPFYIFLHYAEPHNPLNPPFPYKNKYLNQLSKKVDIKKVKKVAHNPLICFVEDLNLNKDEIEVLKALYDGEIAYIDNKIGEILQLLKRYSYYDDTMIIITSDHGEHFGEHNLWSHVASLYNEVLHIPLIIKFPKGVEYVKEVNHYTQLVDLFPTIMEVAGVNKREVKDISGVSLVYRRNSDNKFHNYVFAEWEGRVPYFIKSRLNNSQSCVNINRITNKMWMILDGRYKYISSSNGQDELYDLDNDRKEQNNIIYQYPEIAVAMKTKLEKWKSTMNKKVNKRQGVIDEETRKNLERLGYM